MFYSFGDSSKPDFSATGAPIQFGFVRENTSHGANGYQTESGIDNWSITEHWTGVSSAASPSIAAQPQSQAITIGLPANFSVTATGAAPLTYQWQKDGTNIVGATNAMLLLKAVTLNNAGKYDVIVSNSSGTLGSTIAKLTVTTAASGLRFDKGALRKLGDGKFELHWKGGSGLSLELQASSDLAHWSALAALTNSTDDGAFTDNATNWVPP